MTGRFAGPVAWRGALALAAVAAFAVEFAVPWEHAPSGAPPAATGTGELPRAAPLPAGAYGAIAEHPLFQPSRAPWVAPPSPPAVPSGAPAPPNYILAGVVVSGTARSAILRPANAPTTVLVSEGQALDGWTLRRIDATGLHFATGDQTFDLGFPNAGQSGQ